MIRLVGGPRRYATRQASPNMEAPFANGPGFAAFSRKLSRYSARRKRRPVGTVLAPTPLPGPFSYPIHPSYVGVFRPPAPSLQKMVWISDVFQDSGPYRVLHADRRDRSQYLASVAELD